MKFDQLNEIEKAELRTRVHAYAHEISIASMYRGTPRLRDEVSFNKAVTTAALVYSDYLNKAWDKAVGEPETAMGTLATEVRKDEELRQVDERTEIGLLDAAIEKVQA